MKKVLIDCSEITDWDSFHDIFQKALGFPDFYGRNMNAWIDCMSSLNAPEDGMTKITVDEGDFVILELGNVKDFRNNYPEQYSAIIECSAFVNYSLLDVGEKPVLMLSFFE